MEDLLRKRGAQLHEKEWITEDIEDIFSGGRLQDDQRQDAFVVEQVGRDTWLPSSIQKEFLLEMSPSSIELEDDETLASYGIKNQFMLEVSPPSFQIFVKTWCGKTITLDVQLANTIKDVKGMLFDKLWIPINRQSFVYAGKKLEADSNIGRHSTLHMTMARVKFQDLIKEVLFREVVLEDERPLADYAITLNAEVTVAFEA
ncbi:hypothetical protein Pint_25099 [Pistacia integerrima]|uniref:Uncharacterized protein n=1 Tax=Pistacia integerrima TaxID=434235 RepID=A0ACC0YCV9_9ROSI|nr:hypothetical protein Pint_25099 [Pistacia integerrima]